LQAYCSTRSSRNWLSTGIFCTLLLTACGAPARDHQLDFHALGTEVSVSFFSVSDDQADRASENLQAYFAAVGHDWYPWRPGELQAINEAFAEGRFAIDVSPPLAAVIRRAAEIERLSAGRFNAGLGCLTELWGLHHLTDPPVALPGTADIQACIGGGVGAAILRWDGDTIMGGRGPQVLDLGGIAKGAILDGSINILQELGIQNAIVNIGGDLTVLGDVNGRPARIGIRSPLTASPIAAIDVLAGETIVTSGNYERFVDIDGHRYTHILDPRTGYPVEHTASVTVVHQDAVLADAAATALMVGGQEEFDVLAQALGLDYALLIDASGDLRLTPAMRERLDWLE
jgi:thiamine biosynthesis lipoprotein